MFRKMKKFFGVECDEKTYDALDGIAYAEADNNDFKEKYAALMEKHRKLYAEYDNLKEKYEGSLDEYEKLSKRYFALKRTIDADRLPTMKDEFAPRCVRKDRETWCYFRMRDCTYAPAFEKFLRNSGCWTTDDDPNVRAGYTFEALEPVVEFGDAKRGHVRIPLGSVFLVNVSAPKTDWLIMPEEEFNKDWAPVD